MGGGGEEDVNYISKLQRGYMQPKGATLFNSLTSINYIVIAFLNNFFEMGVARLYDSSILVIVPIFIQINLQLHAKCY